MSKTAMEKAYNARSTRPIWHWWKVSEQPNLYGEYVAYALCGAKANSELLDATTGHLRGCGRCDQKERKLTAK
jgi:hypothetical protein